MTAKFRESTTLKFVLVSYLIMNFMWLSGKVEGTLTEYATSTATILGIWIAREWRAAHYAKT